MSLVFSWNLTQIFLILILIAVFNSQLNDQMTCPIFICSSSTADVNGTCFNNITGANITKIILTDCPTNQYCDIGLYNVIPKTGKSRITCKTIPINYHSGLPVGRLVEYDYCNENEDCSSRNCTNNICYGKKQGGSCLNTTECSSSTYCDNVCVSRKAPGSACVENFECYNNASCYNGICTEYFSYQAGRNLNSRNIARDMKNICFSRYANSDGVCEDLYNTGEKPYYCLVKDGCQYLTSITGRKVTLKENYCSCHYFGNGLANCMLGTDTSSYKNEIEAYLKLWNVGCHFFNRNKCSITPIEFIENLYHTNANVSQQFVGDFDCAEPKKIPVNPATCQNPTCDDTGKVFMHVVNTSDTSIFKLFSLLLFSILFI